MFDNIDGNRDASQIGLDASNPVDFKTIYDAAMQMLFKISYRIVNDEEVAEEDTENEESLSDNMTDNISKEETKKQLFFPQ